MPGGIALGSQGDGNPSVKETGRARGPIIKIKLRIDPATNHKKYLINKILVGFFGKLTLPEMVISKQVSQIRTFAN